jgi:hypothetical protein
MTHTNIKKTATAEKTMKSTISKQRVLIHDNFTKRQPNQLGTAIANNFGFQVHAANGTYVYEHELETTSHTATRKLVL